MIGSRLSRVREGSASHRSFNRPVGMVHREVTIDGVTAELGLCCRFRGLLGWVSAGAPRLVPTFPDV